MSNSEETAVKPKRARAKKPRREDLPNPTWFAPVMFGFMLLGLIWIITFYVTGAQWPLGAGLDRFHLNIGNWNIAVGFGIAMVGFMMSTRWK